MSTISTDSVPRYGRGGTVAAGGLLLLTALVLVLIHRVSALDLTHWQAIHADSNAVWEPAGIYGDGWDTKRFDPFARGHLPLRDLALLVLHVAATLVVGARLLWSSAPTRSWPVGVQLGAGFLIGYLPVVVLSRFVSLWLPLTAAAWVLLTLEGLAACVVLRTFRRHPVDDLGGNVARDRTSLLLIGLLVAATVVWTYQSGRNFLVSDSLVEFLRIAAGELGDFRHLPRFGKQSDEYLFNLAPLTLGSPGSIALWFWLTNALAKASMLCLTFGFASTLTQGRRVPPLLACGLLLFVTPAVDPRYYLSLVGGQNPTVFLGHAGRFVGIVLPLSLLLFASPRRTVGQYVALLMLGCVLVGTSVHNLVTAVAVLSLALTATYAHRLQPVFLKQSRESGVSNLLAALAILAPLVAYGSLGKSTNSGFHGIPVLLGALAAFVLAVGLAADSDENAPPDPFLAGLRSFDGRRALMFLAGTAVGALTMGNIFVNLASSDHPIVRLLGKVVPGLGQPPILVKGFTSGIAPFAPSDCMQAPTAACHSFPGFIGYFGTTFAVAGVMWLVMMGSDAPPSTRRRDRALVMLAILLFDVGLFLTDFLGTSETVVYWSQTRFLEVGYYGLWIMVPIVLANHLHGSSKRLGLAALSAWFIIPLITHPFLAQWMANAAHLARHAL